MPDPLRAGLLSLLLLWLSADLWASGAKPTSGGKATSRAKPTEGAKPTSGAPSPSPVLHTNLGTYHFPISTRSKRAQQYFDQGLRLTYALEPDAAIRSFEAVLRHDPSAGMAYWGIAHALGPNVGAPMSPARERRAVQALTKAQALAKKLSVRERDYLAALGYRYADDPRDHRGGLDRRYADAMRLLLRKYPQDVDAATLLAEALLALAPEPRWTPEGQPLPLTAEIVSMLEGVLKRNPAHPGACHYLLHVLDTAPQPDRARACADRLPDLMPGAGNVLHLSSHLAMRLGRYDLAVERSLQAAHVDAVRLREPGADRAYGRTVYPHHLRLLWAALLMDGRSREAEQVAKQLVALVEAEQPGAVPDAEWWVTTGLFGQVRFRRWEVILAQPEPPEAWWFARGVRHYARGLAFGRLNQLEQADDERRLLGMVIEDGSSGRLVGGHEAKTLLLIAERSLVGELAALRERDELAIQAMQEAVQLEDGLGRTEPLIWPLPVRQALGDVFLQLGRWAEAERSYHGDLARHPNNGWSLSGLAHALTAQHKTEAASVVERRTRAAWARADPALKNPR